MKYAGFAILLLVTVLFAKAENKDIKDPSFVQCAPNIDRLVTRVLCSDDEVLDIDSLRYRVLQRVYDRIEAKYKKKDPKRATTLKEKVVDAELTWAEYLNSHCELETISVTDENEQAEFVKQCILSLTRTHVEDLRLLQISI